ncbi:MAG: SpoIID/LytB domain-containing protein [Actinomycetota bacterium]|nr:SpoIID/LytB domain-containing protein [Actinomycetota bacterium]
MRRAAATVAILTLSFVQAPSVAKPRAEKLGAAVAPLRLVPTGSEPLSVEGLHRYHGSLELDAASDGLVVSNRLSLESYLLGLAEVPSTWPAEALKAQAVAARTYALYTLAQPRGGSAAIYDFDICASVECQVYTGADVGTPLLGDRWHAAVASTKGQAVLYRGQPILARYHSTSGGATLDNPQAFPDEPPYPYLQGVPSPDEEAAPLFRWTVEFPLRRLQTMLERGGLYPPGYGKLIKVTSRPSSAGFHYPDLVLRGKKGTAVATAEEVRDVVRDLAPQMFPAAYPSPGPTSTGRLPETLPSNRVDVFTTRGVVRVVGRGWGHGVGMSQWGAYGLAARGAGYVDILTHYYTGVQVGPVRDPGRLEVGLAWGSGSVAVTGAFDIVDARGRTLVNGALGRWRFDWSGTGVVSIDPPAGYGLPLRVGLVKAPDVVEVGEPAYLTVALSRAARVRTVTAAASGYDDPGAKIARAGRRRIVWLAPLEPGRFEVRIEATAAGRRSRTQPVTIEVAAPPPIDVGEPGEDPEEDSRVGDARFPLLLVGAAAALALLVGFALSLSGRRKLGR